ncbi:antibiotic biosynthesis monooxygenase [Acinetobacter sp. LoGeW2-3]|uniref:antibiotic biosynthesis monooxygenase family protein n=1 Tax=Acinetobacter sp. LoGeW2-3 TaxID=1808001 RepID=UPI000C059B14|nr:antibiotic biosynthesis monooxygenase [Acinetobacter sp. LoGeW2-3]ATO19551.1 antibiotic biosynthesis monooxygenase [Acinetobacter sp. LoGeW2-3]
MRYVVIFKAKIKHLDQSYFVTAQSLREKALSQFHCQQFEALTENNQEVALSYWNSLEDIQAWHRDAEHQVAQQLGKNSWYTYFSVDVCKVLRRYDASIN